MNNPKYIYLEPLCPNCDTDANLEDRPWCSDAGVWDYECVNCGGAMPVVEYKLVDEKKKIERRKNQIDGYSCDCGYACTCVPTDNRKIPWEYHKGKKQIGKILEHMGKEVPQKILDNLPDLGETLA